MDYGASRAGPQIGKRESECPPLLIRSSLPAAPETVRHVRHIVADMAVAAGVQGELLDTIRLVVSEAVTNIVLYAYSAGDGEVRVTAELAEDELRVLVADAGPGIDAGPGSRGLGLGLTLMSAICDGFLVVDRAGRGTELRLRFKLGRSRRQGIVLAAG
jgi:anti-sigma regulatory factor (Ser/Thr protein kinase)